MKEIIVGKQIALYNISIIKVDIWTMNGTMHASCLLSLVSRLIHCTGLVLAFGYLQSPCTQRHIL